MIAMVDRINEKPKFKGKFKKKSFCRWLQLPRKIYIIDGNDSDSDHSSDYDTGDYINGNKSIEITNRRPGIFQLFKL